MRVPAHLILSVAAFVAIPHVAAAQAPTPSQTAADTASQVREAVIQQITLRGTVEAIDRTARTVRVRGDQGNIVTLDVPTSATRFDEVKVGDIVTMTYYDRVSIRPKPAGEADVDRVVPATTTPVAGLVPSGTRTSQRTSTVTIDGWDPVTKTVSFRTASGQSYTRHVNETLDASLLAGLKVGDRVDVTRTEALSLQVEAMAAPASQPLAAVTDSLEHPFTVSFMWGPDNGFSGNALKESSGLLSNGTPISFSETTFDDFYGRIGTFKFGIGYRTSPRAEAIFNIVVAKSDSEPVQIGSIGAANAPLSAHVDDYYYWGVEGGQRFYFARVRFTPFLGYTVGLNKFQQIEGNFTSPALGAQPALTVLDGPLFDDSWTLTLGPTTGLLVGLGPVEFQAELGLKYQSGLNEQDILVGATNDLPEVNTETTRWSIPFLIGARLRF